MPKLFTFGGEQDLIVHGALGANNTWVPNASALCCGLTGVAKPEADAEMDLAVDTGSGFFMQEDVPVSIVFSGKTTAVVALQYYNPIYIGGAAWKTIIPDAEWTTDKGLTILAPLAPWRVGCVTVGADAATLTVTIMFGRAALGRHG